MLKEEVVGFFKGVLPFSFLSESETEAIVSDVVLRYYPKGEKILVQDGSPSASLYVIKKGGVQVFVADSLGEKTVIDYRGVGELFGLLSLLSGDRSRANVVAEEDTICYLIPRERVLALVNDNSSVNQYFFKSFLINFLDKTDEETRKKYTEIGSGEKLLFITRVGDIVRSAPVTAFQGISIRDGARIMAERGISSLIIVDQAGAPLGMVTDRDLREKVVARDLPTANAVSTIMSSSLVTVDVSEFCFEALIRMMHHNVHHIVVMDENRLYGMVTNHDFMVLQGASPAMLVKEIGQFQSFADLQGTAAKFYKTVVTLLRDGARASNITGLITELSEKIINSIVDLIEREQGEAPVAWSLFFYGAGARRELALDFAIGLGIVHQDSDSPEGQAECQRYFAAFTEEFNRAISLCLDCGQTCLAPAEVQGLGAWRQAFEARISEQNSGFLAKFFEMRTVRGAADTVEELRYSLARRAQADKNFMNLVATATVQNRPPLGFFKKFLVDKDGSHKDELDLFRKGVKPLVDSIRLFSLRNGVRHISSKRRLQELKDQGLRSADDIEHALDYLWTLLIHNQILRADQGLRPDTYVNPDSLTGFEQKTLKESFKLAATLYEIIEEDYQTERIK